MLISVTNRFRYIAVPRTSSTATFDALRAFGCALVPYKVSPQHCYAADVSGFHDPHCPDELATYFTFATVRNPYSRIVSHYNFARAEGEPGAAQHRLYALASHATFAEFVEVVTLGGLVATQTAFLSSTRVDAYVYQEGNVGEQLSRLPCIRATVNVPRVNESRSDRPWWAYYSKSTAQAVREWADEDFWHLGYSSAFADAVAGKLPEVKPCESASAIA